MLPDISPLARTLVVPPADPAREQALLDAFVAHHTRRRRPVLAVVAMTGWAVAAGLLVFLATPGSDAPQTPFTDAAFVTLPGAELYPSLDHADIVRMPLPQPYLVSLGLPATARADQGVVDAEVLIGQDGLARAVRLATY